MEFYDSMPRVLLEILLVLYKNEPNPMSEDEIAAAIVEEGLDVMTDEELDKYRKDLVFAKGVEDYYKVSGRLN